MDAVSDRIVKKVRLRARLSEVWHAVANARAFGAWFGMSFDRPFAIGARVTGRLTPTKVDAQVAQLQEPYAGQVFELVIDRIEPQRLFSFRWHPFATDPNLDYSKEETTLVVFELAEVEDGTELTITESGFDRLPPERRAEAFKANEGGWQHQIRLIEKYLMGRAA
jgi:uncharacterized protein YndB with AHSA1/START domain